MNGFEHIELEIKWKKVLQFLSKSFGDVKEIKDLTFLIGVQELGLGFREFSKEEKIDLMHIGVCHLLSQYGYYEFVGRDTEGWPHWKSINSLPELNDNEKEFLLKQAIISYFNLDD